MKLIENMILAELEAERKEAMAQFNSANAAIEKIHGQKNYQDEVAKYFVGGMVGFRKDRKRVNRSINQYTDNAVKACEQYERRDTAEARLKSLQDAICFIEHNAPAHEIEAMTCRMIKERKLESAIESAKSLKWEKVTGHYGIAYQYGGFVVERVDVGFVAVRDKAGNLLTHCKTVKEAKAFVSLAISKTA